MGNKNEQTEKKKIGKKGFWIISLACLAAVAVTSFMAYDIISPSKVKTTPDKTYEAKKETESADSSTPAAPESTETPAETESSSAPSGEEVSAAATFFVMPVSGDVVKGYSNSELQYSETYQDMRLHEGLDIAAEEGTKVTASGAGRVVSIEKSPTLGNVITIDHGNGITAKYCGLADKAEVNVGDTVDSKTVIGKVGEIPAESVEATHFHIEMFSGEKSVSPLKMFGME